MKYALIASLLALLALASASTAEIGPVQYHSAALRTCADKALAQHPVLMRLEDAPSYKFDRSMNSIVPHEGSYDQNAADRAATMSACMRQLA